MWNRVLGFVAIAVTALSAPPVASAQESPSSVIATVNGIEITRQDLLLVSETLGPQIQRIPEQVRMQVLLDVLIDQALLSEVAKQEGVGDSEAYRQRIDYYTRQALRDAYVETVVVKAISDADIEARYQEEIAKIPAEEEVRARHILVETEEEATAIAEAARGGADFAELAKEKSTGPSAVSGGDLDYFTADKMVPEFSQAAFALEVGAISDPVKSQFGWHVIKVEDKRQKAPPALELIRDRVLLLVMRDRVKAEVEALRAAAKIEPAPGAAPAVAPVDGGGQGDQGGTAQ